MRLIFSSADPTYYPSLYLTQRVLPCNCQNFYLTNLWIGEHTHTGEWGEIQMRENQVRVALSKLFLILLTLVLAAEGHPVGADTTAPCPAPNTAEPPTYQRPSNSEVNVSDIVLVSIGSIVCILIIFSLAYAAYVWRRKEPKVQISVSSNTRRSAHADASYGSFLA
jgi:hypothetical protein